jgi:succinoglycan biosynthesis transport protein ExoP
MIDNKSTSIDFIDLDPIFLLSILKRYIIYLIIFASLVSSLVLIYTLNLDKKYKSQAKIVIERDENNIVNIQEYSNMVSSSNRMNNQIALFKSDQVLEYIISNKKNYQQFINFFSENNQNFVQKILKKKKKFLMLSL